MTQCIRCDSESVHVVEQWWDCGRLESYCVENLAVEMAVDIFCGLVARVILFVRRMLMTPMWRLHLMIMSWIMTSITWQLARWTSCVRSTLSSMNDIWSLIHRYVTLAGVVSHRYVTRTGVKVTDMWLWQVL